MFIETLSAKMISSERDIHIHNLKQTKIIAKRNLSSLRANKFRSFMPDGGIIINHKHLLIDWTKLNESNGWWNGS